MYDTDSLIQSATPQTVAEAIGLSIVRKGSHTYCECPSHEKRLGKKDSNVSNCVLTAHGYHCFSCGAKGDVIQMVMDYCNMPFVKAAELVSSITGGNYTLEEETVKKQPFSADELTLIGLTSIANPDGDTGKEILGTSRFRPENRCFFRRGDEYVIYASEKKITLTQLYTESEDIYYTLIEKNAEIALKKYKELLDAFVNRGGETFEKIYNSLTIDGKVNGALLTAIRNIFFKNVQKTEKILEKAKKGSGKN